MADLLLHACCGPCLLAPAAELIARGDVPDVLWYNPNIHPAAEYLRREEHLRAAALRLGLTVQTTGDYDAAAWLAGIPAGGVDRCPVCLRQRLDATAAYAAAHGYRAFTTTMLVSPYLDREAILAAGQAAAARTGIEFISADWRPQFRAAQQQARAWGLYLQNYCGCIYSDNERYQRRQARARKRAAQAATEE